MTRASVAIKLLRHGPLSMADCKTITGWPEKTSRYCIKHLSQSGRIYRSDDGLWTLGARHG